MATEKAEPKSGLIIQIGVGAIVTLLFMHAGLVSYFDRTAKAEEYRKIGAAKPAALMDVRADEKQRLMSGPMPIDKAMQMMKDRTRGGASPDIMPSASLDTAPMQGWVKLPNEVPMPMTMMAASAAQSAAPAPSAAPSPAATPSGALPTTDAGAGGAKPHGTAPAPKHPRNP